MSLQFGIKRCTFIGSIMLRSLNEGCTRMALSIRQMAFWMTTENTSRPRHFLARGRDHTKTVSPFLLVLHPTECKGFVKSNYNLKFCV